MFSEFLKWTKMQNKPTKMESGLIELTKESALGSQQSIRSLKNHRYQYKKTCVAESFNTASGSGFFFSNKNLG